MGTIEDVKVVEAGTWIGRDVAQGCQVGVHGGLLLGVGAVGCGIEGEARKLVQEGSVSLERER